MAAMMEDLPALGKPTSPTSATVFSSRMRSRCCPGSPLRAKPGALRRGLARAALPRPPRPPSAPPSGLNFSRWIEAQPFPPWPACTRSVTRSANSATVVPSFSHRKGGPGCPARLRGCVAPRRALRRRLGGDDAHGPAAAERAELHRPADQREQRVVAAAADALARVEVRTVLADDDLARVHQLAAVALDAEALGLRVAAVTAG